MYVMYNELSTFLGTKASCVSFINYTIPLFPTEYRRCHVLDSREGADPVMISLFCSAS